MRQFIASFVLGLFVGLVLISLSGCHDPKGYQPTTSGGMPEEPEIVQLGGSSTGPLPVRFSHWNADSWDGEGTSLVLCPDQQASSVTLNGDPLTLHGNLDEGRQVWTDYDTPGRTGTVVVTLPQGVMTFIVQATAGIVERGC